MVPRVLGGGSFLVASASHLNLSIPFLEQKSPHTPTSSLPPSAASCFRLRRPPGVRRPPATTPQKAMQCSGYWPSSTEDAQSDCGR